MYRESMLGVALAAAIAEIDRSCSLTEGQKQYLWKVFDKSVDECLQEAPVMSTVKIIAPPPVFTSEPLYKNITAHADAALGLSGARGDVTAGGRGTPCGGPAHPETVDLLTAPLGLTEDDMNSAEVLVLPPTPSAAEAVLADESLMFPIWRVVDGVWTILLKDPTLKIQDRTGRRRTIRLDYMKLYLKRVEGEKSTRSRKRGRGDEPLK